MKIRQLIGSMVLTCMVMLAAMPVSGMGRQVNSNPESGKTEDGFKVIFDGKSLDGWKQAGPGKFEHEPDGSIRSVDGMGLLWYSKEKYRDFILQLEWKAERRESNSGVFVRFPDPQGDPWNPVREGYEVQILDAADPNHRTGAIYSFKGSTSLPTKEIGEWNKMEIKVVGQQYEVRVNGELVTEFTGDRSLEGYVGLQNHGGGDKVWFRNIRVKKLD